MFSFRHLNLIFHAAPFSAFLTRTLQHHFQLNRGRNLKTSWGGALLISGLLMISLFFFMIILGLLDIPWFSFVKSEFGYVSFDINISYRLVDIWINWNFLFLREYLSITLACFKGEGGIWDKMTRLKKLQRLCVFVKIMTLLRDLGPRAL